MKSILIAVATFVLGAALAVFAVKTLVQSRPVPEFHEHADFALFLNGRQFDFSLDKYMSTKPCTISDAAGIIDVAYAHADDSGIGDVVHLHDLDGGVIHVHREGVTYEQFFESLHMAFSDTSFTDDVGNTYTNDDKNVFRFFVNGSEVPTIADRPIRDLDQVLVTYGSRNRTMESISQELGHVSNRACVSSHLCGHRGPVAEESCGATAAKKNAVLKWLGV